MRMETSINQRMDLQLRLAPRMIQSMEILQLPSMALQERIQQELEENPVLELRDTRDDGSESGDGAETAANLELEDVFQDLPAEDTRDPGNDPLVIEENGKNELDFDRLDALSRDYEDVFNEEHRPSRNGLEEESDRRHDAVQNMASPPQSLQEALNEQLAFFDLPPEQQLQVRYLISFIDDNGFLSVPDEPVIAEALSKALAEAREKARKREKDLSNEEKDAIEARIRKSVPRRCPTLEELALGYPEEVTVEQLEEALDIVQKLDPPGVGARDLRECLLLQLNPDMPHRDVLRTLILNHLEDIQHNRLPIIQKKTHFDLATIKEAIEQLKHLNPRPGSQYTDKTVPYVVPDILVEQDEDTGEFKIRLLDDWLPNFYISRRYIDLYRQKGGEPGMKEFLRKKIQSAQWLQEAIEQRRNTLEKVTRAIIQHQRAFLERGPEYIQPLKMQEVADQVGVHVTTVSRAVDDKWVQTPRGLFPLKRFFGGGTKVQVPEGDGEEVVAWEVVKKKLLELIEAEDKANPLSDEDLVTKLNEAGYPIKRRTVTKYRKMADIPSSRQRKEWSENS